MFNQIAFNKISIGLYIITIILIQYQYVHCRNTSDYNDKELVIYTPDNRVISIPLNFSKENIPVEDQKNIYITPHQDMILISIIGKGYRVNAEGWKIGDDVDDKNIKRFIYQPQFGMYGLGIHVGFKQCMFIIDKENKVALIMIKYMKDGSIASYR